ncbi:hypothetical protein DU478_18195 [Thalassococcus profundi]|uniref:TFIIB-type zinc ribbon-containing protein n=1 Tax=Thalassococcus profundi TaxID=2282382 RepID=A0A369TPJ7_9RHOB|nr:hypothetical protein [Thalassococcus profundi]RDD64876.1 hypothetical protein DU478_18195 [Thalassococcus profundi]
MHPTNKIATCCYCGTRAALVLTGEVRHELACASCGAPLHDMKMMPGPEASHGRASRAPARQPRPEVHATPLPLWERERSQKKTRKKKKKSKSLGRKFLKEAFDVLDDIFD